MCFILRLSRSASIGSTNPKQVLDREAGLDRHFYLTIACPAGMLIVNNTSSKSNLDHPTDYRRTKQL